MTATAADGPVAQGGRDRRIVVMIGAPGAGKGTQAELLSDLLRLPHISTGALFREAVTSADPLGEQVRDYVERGALVPDEVTVAMVERRLEASDAVDGAILDGFPRTRRQAEALEATLSRAGDSSVIALYVEVPTQELMARLTGRRVCSVDDQHVYHVDARPPRRAGICDVDGAKLRQRDDDRPNTVSSRLDAQLPPMYEVIDHYAERSVLYPVRGDQPAEAVTQELLEALSAAAKSPSR